MPGSDVIEFERVADEAPRFVVREDLSKGAHGYEVWDEKHHRRYSGLEYAPAHALASIFNRAHLYESNADVFGYGVWSAAKKLRNFGLKLFSHAVAKVPAVNHITQTSKLLAKLGRGKRAKHIERQHSRHLAASQGMYQSDELRARALDHITDEDGKPVYTYNPKASSEELGLWESSMPEKHPHIISARGSKVRSDFTKTDTAIATGQFESTKRWQRSRRDHEKIRRVIGEEPADYTGHSLGGTIAQHLAATRPDSEFVAFNPGHGPVAAPDVKGTSYSVDGDMVSALAHALAPASHRVVRLPQVSPHFVGNHLLSAFSDHPEARQPPAEKPAAVDPEQRPAELRPAAIRPGEITAE